jgi:hypothetical protein
MTASHLEFAKTLAVFESLNRRSTQKIHTR